MPLLLSRKTLSLAFVVSAAVAGCLLTTDLSGLEGSNAAGADGSPESSSLVDAAVDSAADGGGADADAGFGSPCKQTHAFCADFDVEPFDQGWTTKDRTSEGGTLAADPFALSLPRSLRATQPRKTPSPTWLEDLRKRFPMEWRRAVFEGDLYLAPQVYLPGDSNIAIAILSFESSTINSGTVFFIADGAAIGTIESVPFGSAGRELALDPMKYSQWVHVVIDFDPKGTMRYVIGGKVFTKTFTAPVSGSSPAIILQLGVIGFNEPVPALDIRWDNVTVDFP